MIGWEERARVAFAVLWFGTQGALIATAGRRPDRAFGFQMFNESSTLEVRLAREVWAGDVPGKGALTVVEAEDGAWTARDAMGKKRRYRWRDRVPQPSLSTFGTPIHASYGAEAQLARLQLALEDVARHVDDAETHRFALDVVVRKNGREPVKVRLWSAPR